MLHRRDDGGRPVTREIMRTIQVKREFPAQPGIRCQIACGLIKLLAAPVRRIVRFPLFQLAVVVAVILFLQAGDDKSARGQIFNGVDELVESTVGLFLRYSM